MRWLEPILPARRSLLWLISLLLLVVVGGCRQFESWRGEGYKDKDAEWGKQYRPSGPKGQRFFFDERASQIERSLGL